MTAVVEPVPWGKKNGPHFREPGRFLHLSRENCGTLPRRRGIAGHRLKVREGDLVEVDGLRLTSVARTWVDLGSVLPIDDLVVAGDTIVSEHARHFGPPKVARCGWPSCGSSWTCQQRLPGAEGAARARSRVRQALRKQGLAEMREFLSRYRPLEGLQLPTNGQKLNCDRCFDFRIVKTEFPLAE
ncbi:hypothetical protein G9E11_01565 [Arthrobacter sp. IA7]|uniref:hypothetical protein n=1 Tax=Arthrobacter ipis TaxID=2716202 RepID=UPI001687C27B|nr:hypothetical protein [Arthrobacter ipis]MBD1540964.1 hypothetical protein [Arthrobacter ipis]